MSLEQSSDARSLEGRTTYTSLVRINGKQISRSNVKLAGLIGSQEHLAQHSNIITTTSQVMPLSIYRMTKHGLRLSTQIQAMKQMVIQRMRNDRVARRQEGRDRRRNGDRNKVKKFGRFCLGIRRRSEKKIGNIVIFICTMHYSNTLEDANFIVLE